MFSSRRGLVRVLRWHGPGSVGPGYGVRFLDDGQFRMRVDHGQLAVGRFPHAVQHQSPFNQEARLHLAALICPAPVVTAIGAGQCGTHSGRRESGAGRFPQLLSVPVVWWRVELCLRKYRGESEQVLNRNQRVNESTAGENGIYWLAWMCKRYRDGRWEVRVDSQGSRRAVWLENKRRDEQSCWRVYGKYGGRSSQMESWRQIVGKRAEEEK